AFLTTAGTHTRSLSPGAIGDLLRDTVGVDLLAEQAQWSLAKRGPRTLVIWHKNVGLSAPLSHARKARAALKTWLAAAPKNRAGRHGPRAARVRFCEVGPAGAAGFAGADRAPAWHRPAAALRCALAPASAARDRDRGAAGPAGSRADRPT